MVFFVSIAASITSGATYSPCRARYTPIAKFLSAAVAFVMSSPITKSSTECSPRSSPAKTSCAKAFPASFCSLFSASSVACFCCSRSAMFSSALAKTSDGDISLFSSFTRACSTSKAFCSFSSYFFT
uniref:Uncharacterized protein n=1 Tax=uncultured marine virus TaxID=186617 RepID=A0A0F7L3V8_9VIRU|nr:hypothetical protein [uncultured marine virus]